jgi:AcrR family transcriptional regulator
LELTSDNQKKRGRGRPPRSELQIEDMRTHVSSCALRLFQEEGYEAVSMRRLAQEAGLTTMTLYKYFENKIDILRTLWSEVFEELFDELDDIADKNSDPQVRLRKVALHYVNYWLDHRQHYFMIFMSKGISQTDVSSYVEDPLLLMRFALLQNCVAAALGDRISQDVKRLKSELLLCVLNGIAHNLITISGYKWASPEDLVASAIDGIVPD